MNKFAMAFIILIVGFLISLFVFREELTWQVAELAENEVGYTIYLNTWPEGKHAKECLKACEEIQWNQIQKQPELIKIEIFLKDYPESKFRKEATTLKDQIIWGDVLSKNTPADYQQYLKDYPEGQFADIAQKKIEEFKFNQLKENPDLMKVEEYIKENPESPYLVEAEKLKTAAEWGKIKKVANIQRIRTFLKENPATPFKNEAETLITQLQNDDTFYERALQIGTINAYNEFLTQYPGHKREADIKKLLTLVRGDNIITLINKNIIEARVTGNNIQKQHLLLTNKLQVPVTVIIPAGTYFVSATSGVQNMVTIFTESDTIAGNAVKKTVVPVACTNIKRSIPHEENTFSIRAHPPSAELSRFLNYINKNTSTLKSERYTIQAAIWIITDNANYDDLGTLRSGFGFSYNASRSIGPNNVKHAVQLLQKAGINVKNKAIWKDRKKYIQE
jgi:outer membrane protein assembly factor BamD (BamD/ComL family)